MRGTRFPHTSHLPTVPPVSQPLLPLSNLPVSQPQSSHIKISKSSRSLCPSHCANPDPASQAWPAHSGPSSRTGALEGAPITRGLGHNL